jgi:hypothetical protein
MPPISFLLIKISPEWGLYKFNNNFIKVVLPLPFSPIAEANRFLAERYLPKMNEKFSRSAVDGADASDYKSAVPLGTANLADILCFEHERTVTNDYVVRFACRLFQIGKANKVLPRPKDTVIVRIRLDGSLSILWKGKVLLVEEIPITKKGQSDTDVA